MYIKGMDYLIFANRNYLLFVCPNASCKEFFYKTNEITKEYTVTYFDLIVCEFGYYHHAKNIKHSSVFTMNPEVQKIYFLGKCYLCDQDFEDSGLYEVLIILSGIYKLNGVEKVREYLLEINKLF